MPETRAIVFDFDGVIVDSEPGHARAIAVAVAGLGMTFRHEHDFGRYIGRGDRECLHEIAAENGRELSPRDMDLLVQAKAEAFMAAARSGLVRPYPGAVELIRAAAERGPVAVCSGSVRGVVEPVLGILGLRQVLGAVVTCDDVTRNKPDPASYLLAAERLGIDPRQATAIEDSPTGIKAARAAGYRVVGVCHSFSAERLAEAHQVHAKIADAAAALLVPA